MLRLGLDTLLMSIHCYFHFPHSFETYVLLCPLLCFLKAQFILKMKISELSYLLGTLYTEN